MTLAQFLTSPDKHAWITYKKARVYLRKSHRIFNKDLGLVPCIDIASIAIEKPRQGIFTALVAELQEKTGKILFVENTHIDFAVALTRHGWISYCNLTDEDAGIYCLYLPAKKDLSP